MKTCSNPECQAQNPQPEENFPRCKSCRGGRRPKCRSCCYKATRAYQNRIAKPPNHPEYYLSGLKCCANPTCQGENPQPVSNFYKHKDSPQGRRGTCIPCYRKREAQRARENHIPKPRLPKPKKIKVPKEKKPRKKRILIEGGKKTCTNPQCSEKDPQVLDNFYPTPSGGYFGKCKVCTLQERAIQYKDPAYARKNLARTRERYLRIRKTEKFRQESRWRGKAKKALKRSLRGKVSRNIEEKLLELQEGKCYYCSSFIGDGWYHWEHKTPLSRGGLHDDSNIVLSCPICNMSKSSKTEEEFRDSLRFRRRIEEVIAFRTQSSPD